MPCASYSHLSSDKREQISILRHSGYSIGELLGRSKSTISRELSRNRLPSDRYSPNHADGSYMLRIPEYPLTYSDNIRPPLVSGCEV